MPQPKDLYYTPTQSQLKFTDNPTGVLDVNQLIIGKAPWIKPTPREKKQKKIIIADWTARSWSEEKIAAVQKALGLLIDEGFSLYMDQSGQIKPLLKQDLPSLADYYITREMGANYPEDITTAAVIQQKLTRDDVYILDDYWLQFLLNEQSIPEPRVLKTSSYSRLEKVEREKLISVIKKSSPPLTSIVHDEFTHRADEVIQEIKDHFPEVGIITKFQLVMLNSLGMENLLNNQTHSLANSTLNFQDLTSIKELFLNDTKIDNAKLKLLRIAAFNLEALGLIDTSITITDLHEILTAALNLKKLILSGCEELYGDFTIPVGSLSSLEEVCLLESNISQANLHKILAASPKLERLFFRAYKEFNGDITIEKGSLSSLKRLALSQSNISTSALQRLLAAAPNIRTLLLYDCNELNGDLTIPVGSLNSLEEIDLSGCPMSQASIRALRAAAPNLKVINGKSLNLEDNATDPKHDPAKQKDIKPTSLDFLFQYQGRNKSKNQGMIIEKFCQYLTIKNKKLAIIPKIQDGICNALSHLFINSTSEQWGQFINSISSWDGRQTSLTDDLTKHFDNLCNCIQQYQLGSTLALKQNSNYLGDNLIPFLVQLQEPCVLSNPWHAIAIKPGLQVDTWTVYDPNFVNGAREVSGVNNLKKTIQDAIGSQVAVKSPESVLNSLNSFMSSIFGSWWAKAMEPIVNNPNLFIEQGGLLTLIQSTNAEAILKQIPSGTDFSLAALDGLLLRDVNGMPAWVAGIKDPNQNIVKLTYALLQQFIKKNQNYQQALEKSIEVMNPLEKQECITRIIQLAPSRPSNPEAVLPRDNLINHIRTAPVTNLYEQRLKTWHKAKARAETLPEYCQHTMARDGGVKKRLIELSSTRQVNALRYALEHYGQNTHRPVFYIHSPDDLVCSRPFIKREGDIGRLHKGPGGPLHDFLEANNQGQSPVLIVNYEQFQADDFVRLNSLIDKERRADGTPVPEDALVIGLININKPDCYQGSDFYSRFDMVEICAVATQELEQAIPILPMKADDGSQKSTVINLFHAANWKELLLGSWVLENDNLRFQEGELESALAKKTTIKIENGLWQDDEFKRFWQEAFQRGGIYHAGRTIPIPKDLQLMEQEGYDWETLKSILTLSTALISDIDDLKVLNTHCLSQFIGCYQYDQATQTLVNVPGLIKANSGKELSIHVTRSLSNDEWAIVLTECQKHRVKLSVHCAPGVKLPEELGVFTAETQKEPWNGKVSSRTQIITSTEVDTTVSMLSRKGVWQVIDVSECKPSDLLERIDGTLNEEKLRFEFKKTTSALLKGLSAEKNIILKGRFSAELADQLAPLLLERQRTKEPLGQLVVVSEEAGDFQYLPTQVHAVSQAEKIACLGELPQELRERLSPFIDKEPLSTLEARRDFWLIHPKATASDDAWLGLRSLTGLLQPLAPLNPQTCPEECYAFTQSRLRAVNNALSKAPYVFIAGLSGVGKSTFVAKELCQVGDTLYQGDNKIKAWASDTSTTGRKILFLDEATLSARDWSEFEGLFHIPPGILVEGQFYPLSSEHKVVFAGNPVSYGDERKLATLFQRHGNTVVFEPLPTAVLYQEILKPVFAKTKVQEKEANFAAAHFLDVYRFLVSCSTTDVLISPRELQMMALLTVSHCQRNPNADVLETAQLYAFELAKHLVPKANGIEFDNQFKPKAPMPLPAISEREEFLITPSRKGIRQHLVDILALRQLRRQGILGNEAQQYGGLGGIILDGEPGIGKSELVISALRAQGFQEIHDFIKPVTIENPFYRMPVSLSLAEKEALLLKAFHEGAVVVIDEINSSPMMERLLNDLLMGKTSQGDRPKNPGFMVIGTQNPVTMAGRRAASTALSRRLMTQELPPYPDEEMKLIIVKKGVPSEQASAMIAAFNKNIAYAKRNHLSPVPTFRDLLRLADEFIEGKKDLLEKGKGEAQHNFSLLEAAATETYSPVLVNATQQYKTLLKERKEGEASEENQFLKSIQNAMQQAENNYTNYHTDRSQINSDRGHKSGFFTAFRHGKNGQMKAEEFNKDIKSAQTIVMVIECLDKLLTDKNTQYHTHSFASYVLDEVNKFLKDKQLTTITADEKGHYSPDSWSTAKRELEQLILVSSSIEHRLY